MQITENSNRKEVIGMTGFVGENLRLIREAKGISRYRLSRMTNIPYQMLYEWEKGHRNPSIKHLAKLSAALGVSVDALLHMKPSSKDNSFTLRLPIVIKVRAGEAVPPTILDGETIEVTVDMAQKADAVVEVKGDSMEPELHEGDLCGVRWQDYAAHGQFVVAQIDDFDDLTIKRFVDKGDYFVLEPLNRKYHPYSSKRHRIRILGKVTWVLRYYERP